MGPIPKKKSHQPASDQPTTDQRGNWYAACKSAELNTAPLAQNIAGLALVLFRDAAGEPGALLDQCPHRQVPLSEGQVDGGLLRCAHHGWEFGIDGHCKHIPGDFVTINDRTHSVRSFTVKEENSEVWVWISSPSSDAMLAKD